MTGMGSNVGFLGPLARILCRKLLVFHMRNKYQLSIVERVVRVV
jgi:hypothetical protein